MGNILNKKKKKLLKKEKEIKNLNNNNKKEIKSLNNYNDKTKKDNNEDLNTKEINLLKNLVNDSFGSLYLGNIFITFKSINNLLLLIYSNQYNSLITYDLINFKKINVVKKAHCSFISNFNHYLDYNDNRDLILSVSSIDNNIKVWNVNNFECLLNIKKINTNGFLESACFLNYNNQIFIVSSNANNIVFVKRESVKIFDFKGRKIKEIANTNEDTYLVDTYYDNKLSKIFIIVCCANYFKSYDYNRNLLYHKYFDFNDKPRNLIISNKEEMIVIFESSYDGNIRIWDFHSGLLLKKIPVNYKTLLRGICLLDDIYIFVGCDDNEIRLINFKSGQIIKKLSGHIDRVISVKIINHPKYGKCLLSQAANSGPIKIWTIKN